MTDSARRPTDNSIPMHIRWHRDSMLLIVVCLNCGVKQTTGHVPLPDAGTSYLHKFADTHRACKVKLLGD